MGILECVNSSTQDKIGENDISNNDVLISYYH